ncbi:PREDICTED: dirigent protein 21 [Theobroma cacao]|uniref:Dirigent protein n=1 Tax=Theobroma cacao TaxID=3641 RepID=A0AB32UZK6_THECC|nr:PREDICTED: dirigent protein 21 [Theobroma cacao]
METKTNVSLVFLVVSGIVMVFFSVPAKADDGLKETNMTVYFHDYSSGGPNSTDLPVVGFPGKLWNFTQFGTLYVVDDLVTEGPELTSATVGRGQGTYVITSLDGLNAYVSFSLVFTNMAYNGSTIQILGNNNQFKAVREYSVASGTGKFRYATGYATFETIFLDQSTSYSILRVNVSARHY